MSLGPVDCFGDGLREAVEALPPSMTSLALRPNLHATRDGDGGGWLLTLRSGMRSVPAARQLCAAFDRPGLPCVLEGQVALSAMFPPEGTPQALGTYLGQCTELAGRLRGGGTDGLWLILVADEAGWGDDDGAAAGGGAEGARTVFSHVLGAMLPAVAPHVRRLQLRICPGRYPTGWSRHLAAPGLAFPLLQRLQLVSFADSRRMAAADVAALALLAAPRLVRLELLCSAHRSGANPAGGVIQTSTGDPCSAESAVAVLAMGLARPVDAEGRPTSLHISTGCLPSAHASGQELEGMLRAAGRGWLGVSWATVAAP